jgi:hypothetical protein
MRQRFKNGTTGPHPPDQIVEESAHAAPNVGPGSFQEALKHEFGISVDRRLSQDLADGLISRVQDQIREQSCYAGYSSDAIIEGVRA